MIRYYFRGQLGVKKEGIQLLDEGLEQLIWIDLLDTSLDEI